MTKAKARDYQIQYTDQSSRIIDWTAKEFQLVCEAMAEKKHVVVLDEGVFVLHDIRTIVRLPEPPKEPTKKEQIENKLTEWGFVDFETAQWLRDMGIDISEVNE